MRLRITFSKTPLMRYTGHLDLHRTWERTIRRARLPLSYSEGFNPHPKINLGSALPLGFTSECERIDMWLAEPLSPDDVLIALRHAIPPGIELHAAEPVDARAPALQTQIASSDYRVFVDTDLPPEEVDRRIAEMMARPQIPRERRGKTYDLRPLVTAIERDPGDTPGITLVMRLAAREGATGRPEEVLAALGLEGARARVHREKLNLLVDNPV